MSNLQWLCIRCHLEKTRVEEGQRREVGKPSHPGLRGGG